MKKNKSQQVASSLAVVGVLLCFFGALVLYSHGLTGVAAQKKPVDLYADETDIHDLTKTTNLEAEIYMTLDYFATETTTTTNNGNFVSRDVDHYFIIPAFSGDDAYFIGIRVDKDDVNTFMTISDETYEYVMGDAADFGMTTIMEEGTLKDMDDEMYGYFVEWFEESGWFENESDIAKYVLPLYFDPANMANSRLWFRIAGAALLVGIILLVLALVSYLKNKKAVKEQVGLIFNGTTYSKEALSSVNTYVQQKENVFAMQELSRITGITMEEAKEVIDNWGSYYL